MSWTLILRNLSWTLISWQLRYQPWYLDNFVITPDLDNFVLNPGRDNFLMNPGCDNFVINPGYNNFLMKPGCDNFLMNPGCDNFLTNPGCNNFLMNPGCDNFSWTLVATTLSWTQIASTFLAFLGSGSGWDFFGILSTGSEFSGGSFVLSGVGGEVFSGLWSGSWLEMLVSFSSSNNGCVNRDWCSLQTMPTCNTVDISVKDAVHTISTLITKHHFLKRCADEEPIFYAGIDWGFNNWLNEKKILLHPDWRSRILTDSGIFFTFLLDTGICKFYF